ncbi:unnamed protein product, partial [Didymodactylos carnosus]
FKMIDLTLVNGLQVLCWLKKFIQDESVLESFERTCGFLFYS